MIRLFKIKSDKLDVFLQWGKYLESNPEARETLKEEQVRFEGFYYAKIGNDYYAFGVADNPKPLPATDRELNRKHKSVLHEVVESTLEIQPVYELRSLSDMGCAECRAHNHRS